MLVVLWQRSPRALDRARRPAPRDRALPALDVRRRCRRCGSRSPTRSPGLGNHRHFHERLQRELAPRSTTGSSLALCLVDIDDFKSVNDRYGHPVGDRVLGQVASRLRQGGESFRLGGDEFAVLLPGHDEREAAAVARSIVERVAALRHRARRRAHGQRRRRDVSRAGRRARRADPARRQRALLGEGGRQEPRPRVRGRVDPAGTSSSSRTARTAPRATARRRASRRRSTRATRTPAATRSASASSRRASPAGSALDEPEVELTRLAGSLHDLGKLAIPEEILRKPGALNEAERLVLQRHPQIGYRMLESLGVEPVAEWVLHHHERWDGDGYPNRLAGDADPARRADHLRRRRLRRDDVRARLPQAAVTARGARGARALRRHAVRSAIVERSPRSCCRPAAKRSPFRSGRACVGKGRGKEDNPGCPRCAR